MRVLSGITLLVTIAGAAMASQDFDTLEPRRLAAVMDPGAAAPTQRSDSPHQEANDRTARQILDRLAGREKEPASRVFKNIRLAWLKSVPAEDFISIMNMGYSRALGVACSHCHVEDDFASDNKRPKRIAREMAVMHKNINDQLGKMRNLRGTPEERFINCAVCHRGTTDPRNDGG
jgi:Photosynthetic reaction centre cytochrome C subunit